MEIKQLLIALPVAMAANIIFGTVIAAVQVQFDRTKFFVGFVKALGVYVGIGCLYIVSLLIPIVNIEGIGTVEVLNAMIAILSAAIALYIGQALGKLARLFGVKYPAVKETV